MKLRNFLNFGYMNVQGDLTRRINIAFEARPNFTFTLRSSKLTFMAPKEVTLKHIAEVVSELMGEQIHFAFLLGSAGTKRFHSESDIDLAVYFKNLPDFEKLSELKLKLYDYFDRDCDLVVLNNIDPIYAMQVLETGRELLIKDRQVYHLWKAEQLSRYPDFKESRAVIEKNLLNRKKYV